MMSKTLPRPQRLQVQHWIMLMTKDTRSETPHTTNV
jgi:hypothetical protein